MGYKEIIYVNGDDAELVRKAASIEEERLQKIPTTHASTNTPKLSCPIYFEEGSGSADYDTVQKRDELVAKCQTAYGLADEPELYRAAAGGGCLLLREQHAAGQVL